MVKSLSYTVIFFDLLRGAIYSMKLLIVDDEKLTREGILKSLPLEKLGIHHTFMADDGVHGLEIA